MSGAPLTRATFAELWLAAGRNPAFAIECRTAMIRCAAFRRLERKDSWSRPGAELRNARIDAGLNPIREDPLSAVEYED